MSCQVTFRGFCSEQIALLKNATAQLDRGDGKDVNLVSETSGSTIIGLILGSFVAALMMNNVRVLIVLLKNHVDSGGCMGLVATSSLWALVVWLTVAVSPADQPILRISMYSAAQFILSVFYFYAMCLLLESWLAERDEANAAAAGQIANNNNNNSNSNNAKQHQRGNANASLQTLITEEDDSGRSRRYAGDVFLPRTLELFGCCVSIALILSSSIIAVANGTSISSSSTLTLMLAFQLVMTASGLCVLGTAVFRSKGWTGKYASLLRTKLKQCVIGGVCILIILLSFCVAHWSTPERGFDDNKELVFVLIQFAIVIAIQHGIAIRGHFHEQLRLLGAPAFLTTSTSVMLVSQLLAWSDDCHSNASLPKAHHCMDGPPSASKPVQSPSHDSKGHDHKHSGESPLPRRHTRSASENCLPQQQRRLHNQLLATRNPHLDVDDEALEDAQEHHLDQPLRPVFRHHTYANAMHSVSLQEDDDGDIIARTPPGQGTHYRRSSLDFLLSLSSDDDVLQEDSHESKHLNY